MDHERAESDNIDRLVFIERHDEGPVGAITLKDLLSWATELPTAIVRPDRKGPALRVKCVDTEQSGVAVSAYKPKVRFRKHDGSAEHIVLVSDVATTGKTILDAVRLINQYDGVVDAAFVLYDRMEGAEAALKQQGIRLAAMLSAERLREMFAEYGDIKEIGNKKEVTESS